MQHHWPGGGTCFTIPKQQTVNFDFRSRLTWTSDFLNWLQTNCTSIDYEHQLKSDLIIKWSEWINTDMRTMLFNAQNNWYSALRDPTSEQAEWELTEIDVQLVWAWARKELILFDLSLKLEDNLHLKMELCASEIGRTREDMHLRHWMLSEFKLGRGSGWNRKEKTRRREWRKQWRMPISDLIDRDYSINRITHAFTHNGKQLSILLVCNGRRGLLTIIWYKSWKRRRNTWRRW